MRSATRIGARLPIGFGAAIAAVGVALLIRVGADSTYWQDVFGPIVITGLGVTLLVAPLTATVLAAAPNQLSGVASGINNAVARSGSLLAVAALPLVAGLSGADYGDPVALTHAYRMAIAVCTGCWWCPRCSLASCSRHASPHPHPRLQPEPEPEPS